MFELHFHHSSDTDKQGSVIDTLTSKSKANKALVAKAIGYYGSVSYYDQYGDSTFVASKAKSAVITAKTFVIRLWIEEASK